MLLAAPKKGNLVLTRDISLTSKRDDASGNYQCVLKKLPRCHPPTLGAEIGNSQCETSFVLSSDFSPRLPPPLFLTIL
jgi:hypothetical protein